MPHDHPNTHVVLVLDASGNMRLRRAQALECVNEFIRQAKQDRDLYEVSFSLITFSSDAVTAIRKMDVMETVRLVTADEYRCSSATPLFDAVVSSVTLAQVWLGET
jgi:Mg-chelatase subunit ChlD